MGSTREWAAMGSITSKFGLRDDAGNAARLGAPGAGDGGMRPGVTSEKKERIRQLERENYEFGRANEILKGASAFLRGSSRPATAQTVCCC